MPYHIDLGGAPANEPCAQLGHTPDFAAVNAFEVSAYRLAVIAFHGLPPEGCRLAAYANHHDFGTYRTLVLHIDDEADAHVAAYAEAVEEGLSNWISACFSPPVEYDGCVATIPRREATELLIGALLVSRPSSPFPISSGSTPTSQRPSPKPPRPPARVLLPDPA